MITYTQDHMDELLSDIDRYFEVSKDTTSFLWALTNVPLLFPDLIGGKSFGDGKAMISIIEQFDGRKPGKLYHDYKTRRYDVLFSPTLILDSQLVTYLSDYVLDMEAGTNKLPPVLRDNVKGFLDFVIERKYDFNPFFYYVESVAKDSKGKFEQYVKDSAIALFKLHSMNEEEFLRSGAIVIDRDHLQNYQRTFGGTTVEETALLRSKELSKNLKEVNFGFVSKFIYASLLQMAILWRDRKLDVIGKLGKLRDFMENRLNMVMTQETFVAIFYFSGMTGSFIPVAQPGLNLEKALSKFQSTTWDLMMMRVPPMQLMFDSEAYTSLGFICTADQAFAKIASQIVIAGITRLPFKIDVHSDKILFKHEEIGKVIGKEALEQINNYIGERAYYREAAKLYDEVNGVKDRVISEGELSSIVRDLEAQFAQLCSRVT